MACLYIVSIKLAPAGGGSLGVQCLLSQPPPPPQPVKTGEAPAAQRRLAPASRVWETAVLWAQWVLWESPTLGLSLLSRGAEDHLW